MAEKKVVEGFDLTKVATREKANEGVEMEITHPATGEGIGAFLTVQGEDSDAHKRALARIAERKSREQRRTGRMEVSGDDVQFVMLYVALECVSGWRGVLENGKPLEFNRANLRHVLTEYRFITEQVNAFVGDRANFLPGS